MFDYTVYHYRLCVANLLAIFTNRLCLVQDEMINRHLTFCHTDQAHAYPFNRQVIKLESPYLKLYLATATHNFDCVILIYTCFIF